MFLSNLQYLNFQNKMVKKLTNQDSEGSCFEVLDNELPLNKEPQNIGDNTEHTSNNITAILASRPFGNSKAQASRIQKTRKSRTYNPDDRFMAGHIKRYYLFPFYYSTLFPYFKISWKTWKPNSVYKKMAQFLSNVPGLPNKTSVQCKSFDQRMKDLNYVSQSEPEKVDLFEVAISYLKEERLEQADKEVIENYIQKMNERSSYMNFLSANSIEEEVSEELESKKSSENFIPDEKKEDTCIEPNNIDVELIFNEFLDVQK